MGLPRKLSVLFVITFFALYLEKALADTSEQKVLRRTSSLENYSKDSSNANTLFAHSDLDGMSFESAVRLGLPLGPLIRGKALSEKLIPANKLLDNGQTSSQNHE